MVSKDTEALKTTDSREHHQGCTTAFGGQPDLHPYVRYAEDRDDGEEGAKQYGKLRSVHDPIPDDAIYGSPVYLLTEKQRDKLESFVSGWEMRDGCIATKLQNQCEAENRVLYPVLIESDSDVALPTQINWMWALVEEHIPISVHDCRWYYSGDRSIHCHVPLFTTKDGIDYLKEVSKDVDGELDEAIYGRKRQFRLPGVVHDEKGLPKTRIDPEWRHEDPEEGHRGIVREAVTTDSERPETYADLVRDVYGLDVLDRPTDYLWNPSEPDEPKSEPHLWEPGTDRPFGEAEDKWEAYNRHAFSPYALSGNGFRSMALVRPIGGAYGQDCDTYLPCRIHIAKGCNGDFWHYDGECPVKLSGPDYRKLTDMDVEPGDDLLIIGGKSGRSRIFRLTWDEVGAIWDAIIDENAFDNDREETL